MDSYPDLICVGNSVLDIFLEIQDENRHINFNEQTREMLIPLGDKINLDGYKMTLGGSASNVAVGLSRLGLKTSVFSHVGDDEFAEKIKNLLEKEEVFPLVVKNKGMESSFSIILNYKKERTIFSQHMEYPGVFDLDSLKSQWFYLASLGRSWKTNYESIIRFVSVNNINLAYNPGALEIESQSPLVYKAISISKVLILNRNEAIQLVEHSDREILDLLKELKNLGPRIVIITDGTKGSFVMDEKDHAFYLSSFPSDIVDPTGAGDAFSTGFLFGHVSGKSLNESMKLGAANAANVVRYVGSEDGLIKLSEIGEKIKKFEQYNIEAYNG